MGVEVKTPKKLIEVALPLDVINAAAAKEKSIRHGHPSTLHLWWARRPLAAARAVLFAQLVNDPGYERHLGRGVNKEAAAARREQLFGIIRELVDWDNLNDQNLLNRARTEIANSWRETCALNAGHPNAKEMFNPEKMPEFIDPFGGGGAIPLEAQRLGLVTSSSDLNPVAVLINKAMIEAPARFQDRPAIGPGSQSRPIGLPIARSGAEGMAEDIRRYGAWIRERVWSRVGHLYPPVTITRELAHERPDLVPLIGNVLTVIAYIWARTVRSPNPAFSDVPVPLASSFVLSSKPGREAVVEPIVRGASYRFQIRVGKPPNYDDLKKGTKSARGANFRCVLSNSPIEGDYIKSEGRAGRIGTKLMAIVAEGPRGRIFLPPTPEEEARAASAVPTWIPETPIGNDPRALWTPPYGLVTFGDLFTSRQLLVLSTFSTVINEMREKILADAIDAGWHDDGRSFENGGNSSTAYADAIALYLAFALDRVVERHSTIATWDSSPTKLQLRNTFARQAIPMTWDFGEGNPFSDSSGTWTPSIEWVAKAVEFFPRGSAGRAFQADAAENDYRNRIVSCDPPYYDNIGYADLSEFFYVWLRRTLGSVFPSLFEGVSVPKAMELVANPYRHGGKAEAEQFFLAGMTATMKRIAQQSHPAFPVTIYYAFKQSESGSDGTSSTGWETFLGAVIKAGFSISGTWPMRTELGNRMIGIGANALASCIILVCRQRAPNAQTISRREFQRELNSVLPEALAEMTTGAEHSPVAPVDLSQAIIGPGMAIFSKYSAVLEANGHPMKVGTALQLINRYLAQDDFDHDTQFCIQWFEQHGWEDGRYGEADVLARAKGTSVDGLSEAGIVESGSGALRLLRPADFPSDWEPDSGHRLSIWEILHHMIKRFHYDGESGAGEILAKSSNYADNIRVLAYRLYTLCERKSWSQDASQYNSLVIAWEAIEGSARATGFSGSQISLFGEDQIKQTTETTRNRKRKKK